MKKSMLASARRAYLCGGYVAVRLSGHTDFLLLAAVRDASACPRKVMRRRFEAFVRAQRWIYGVNVEICPYNMRS